MTSQWRSLPGFPNYAVSDEGGVRSTRSRWGTLAQPRAISPWITRAGYAQVTLANDDGRKKEFVHSMVLRTFIGSRPIDMPDIRHLDGNKLNNRLDNLAYGTRSANEFDKVRHGAHHYAKRSHCAHGHEFAGPNLIFEASANRRVCRTCRDARLRIFRSLTSADRAARKMAGLPVCDLAAYFAESEVAA